MMATGNWKREECCDARKKKNADGEMMVVKLVAIFFLCDDPIPDTR